MVTHEVFHFDNSKPNFDSLGNHEGIYYWKAKDLMKWLDYYDWELFKSIPILLAKSAIQLQCILPLTDHFKMHHKEYILSKFACMLISSNCDFREKQVKQAAEYFKTAATQYIEDNNISFGVVATSWKIGDLVHKE
jgi:hypothetical protein